MRKLASIQRIKKLRPIENADAIEVATVLGWQCVVKKEEFKEGNLCIFFEVDSFLPVDPRFEFVGNLKKMLVDGQEVQGYLLETVRLRGQISQGLALPLGDFADKLKVQDIWEEGTDVTEKLGVLKYEPPIPASLAGTVRGPFPWFIPKTDELRLQTIPEVLDKYHDTLFYCTEKIDGTSMTVFYNDDGLPRIVDGVSCSRPMWRKEALQALGNAIVPQVAIEIMKAIKQTEQGGNI